MNSRNKSVSPPKSPTTTYTTKKIKLFSYLYKDIIDKDDYYEYY